MPDAFNVDEDNPKTTPQEVPFGTTFDKDVENYLEKLEQWKFKVDRYFWFLIHDTGIHYDEIGEAFEYLYKKLTGSSNSFNLPPLDSDMPPPSLPYSDSLSFDQSK